MAIGYPIDLCFQLNKEEVNLKISIDRRIFIGKIRATIKNIGETDVSNVNWEVDITAGVRKKPRSFTGTIGTIKTGETAKIRTGRAFLKPAIKFRFGRIKGTITASVGNYDTTLEFSGFILGRLIFIPKNQF